MGVDFAVVAGDAERAFGLDHKARTVAAAAGDGRLKIDRVEAALALLEVEDERAQDVRESNHDHRPYLLVVIERKFPVAIAVDERTRVARYLVDPDGDEVADEALSVRVPRPVARAASGRLERAVVRCRPTVPARTPSGEYPQRESTAKSPAGYKGTL